MKHGYVGMINRNRLHGHCVRLGLMFQAHTVARHVGPYTASGGPESASWSAGYRVTRVCVILNNLYLCLNVMPFWRER